MTIYVAILSVKRNSLICVSSPNFTYSKFWKARDYSKLTIQKIVAALATVPYEDRNVEFWYTSNIRASLRNENVIKALRDRTVSFREIKPFESELSHLPEYRKFRTAVPDLYNTYFADYDFKYSGRPHIVAIS